MIVEPEKLSPRDRYFLMIGCIVPRPIAFVSSLSGDGVRNLAPFSYFSGVSSTPPVLCVSIAARRGKPKDTLSNIRETGEFVVNVVDESLAERMNLLLTHSIGCTAQFTQYAGIEAISGSQDWVDEMVSVYQTRRDLLVTGLNAIPGVSCRTPMGAFYTFPNIQSFGLSSDEMANLILERANVALLPGTSFGKYGQGYLRIVYANSLEKIEQALVRIGDVLADLEGINSD